MAKLFLVRHGDTDMNSRERYWGQTDIRLSAAGVEQAERLRDRLAAEKLDAVYSSDLQRAVATAEIIASGHRLDVITCAELRETDFGRIEGLTFDEISHRFPELASLWKNWSLQIRFPGGENLVQVGRRVKKFAHRLGEHKVEETILIAAHSATLRLLICRLLGVDTKHWRQFRLDLASLSVVETYPDTALLSLLNDTSHLR